RKLVASSREDFRAGEARRGRGHHGRGHRGRGTLRPGTVRPRAVTSAGGPPASAGDLPGLDAGRAHVQPLGRSVDLGVHDLDVGVPAARGAAVRVGDPVAEARPLAADVADSSHGIAPLVWMRKLDAAPAPPGPAVEGYP